MVQPKNESPLVSIGLPVFNGEAHIEQAIESLLSQTYDHFELIIADNCSTDSTYVICNRYASKDNRIRLHKNEANIGSAKNFEKVLDLAKGEFFMWAAHDDWWHCEFISKCLVGLQKYPSASLCYPLFERENIETGKRTIIDPSIECESRSARKRLQTAILKQNTARGFYGLIRAGTLKKTRIYDCFGFDRAVLDQLAILGTLVCVSEVLVRYRWVPNKSDAYLATQQGIMHSEGRPYARKTSELKAVLCGLINCAPMWQVPVLAATACLCYGERYGGKLRSEWSALIRSWLKSCTCK
jgi:hypothetical protein